MGLLSRPGHTIRRLSRRLGRRGFFLLFLAFLNSAVGSSLISDTSNPLRHYDTTLPLPAWGWTWVAAGVIHLWYAFRINDRVSFTVAAFVKGAWAAMYIDLTVTQGYPRGWVFATLWGFFAINVLMIASWPEPPPRNGSSLE